MKTTLTLLAIGTALAAPAGAETFSVVGSWSSLPLNKAYEVPYWTEVLPAALPDVDVEMTTHNEMNLGVADVYPLLGQGVFDVAMTVGDYAVADAPELEGLDVPLLALTADEARAMVDAAMPMLTDIFRDRFNAEVLAVAPYPPQIVFCNREIAGLDDLAGLKIRASGRMTAKLLEALGAEGVNVSFAEVPGALQNGVVDCAVTGAGSGYSAGWWEVSTHLLPLPLGGWDPVVTAMNLDRWSGLDTGVQDTIRSTIEAEFEDPAWASAQNALTDDIACLTGNGECPAGDARSMVLVEVSDADFARARDILTTEVLPEWAERAGGDWAQRWNDSVGAVVGVTHRMSRAPAAEMVWIDRLRRINRGVALVAGTMLLACAGFVLLDIVMRRLGSSLGGTEEIAGYAMAIGTAWGMSYALLELGHVRIDLLRARGGTMARALADVFSMIVLSATVVFVAVQAWPVVARSLENGSRANTPLETPLAWVQVPWFAGWLWFAIVSCALTLLTLSMVVRGRAAETEAAIGAFAEADALL